VLSIKIHLEFEVIQTEMKQFSLLLKLLEQSEFLM
jgi:hypothetical protein